MSLSVSQTSDVFRTPVPQKEDSLTDVNLNEGPVVCVCVCMCVESWPYRSPDEILSVFIFQITKSNPITTVFKALCNLPSSPPSHPNTLSLRVHFNCISLADKFKLGEHLSIAKLTLSISFSSMSFFPFLHFQSPPHPPGPSADIICTGSVL